MSSSKTQVVRVPLKDTERLNRIGKELGVSQSQLVRWAIEALISDVETKGGSVTLPYKFPDSVKDDDVGRSLVWLNEQKDKNRKSGAGSSKLSSTD